LKTRPVRFIDKPVEVHFSQPPTFEKAPPCPASFLWRGDTYRVTQLLEEWHDFTRRGRFARNMVPGHAARAGTHGSWGVGKYRFRVLVHTGQIFELVYDRAPADSSDRKGNWFLMGERLAIEPADTK
jgi:hypothetical protein